ncbi:MAG: alpha/beta fold hydrolase, partial [Isosphaeraceae bacterium]|nr:alpha/beta fold hydrolase [Isosphaeraceae bacterium]
MRFPRLYAPIILAHGLFGFDRIGLGPITLATYFRHVPEALRAAGNRVLVPRVHPTAGVARRAGMLAEQIEAAFGAEPVHLIGHSMGGLDARALLADPAWSGRALSLTTIGTPHLGSSLADAARHRMGPAYRLLERLRLDHQALLDLRSEAARAWHLATPPPERVACFSVAGDPPPDEVSWSLRPLHEALARWEGPNDGLVSVASAQAFGTPLRTWPLDHLQQIGWSTPLPPRARVPRRHTPG